MNPFFVLVSCICKNDLMNCSVTLPYSLLQLNRCLAILVILLYFYLFVFLSFSSKTTSKPEKRWVSFYYVTCFSFVWIVPTFLFFLFFFWHYKQQYKQAVEYIACILYSIIAFYFTKHGSHTCWETRHTGICLFGEWKHLLQKSFTTIFLYYFFMIGIV